MLLLGEGSEATEPYNKYDKIRPHSFRSLQFDQKVRPLSFRPEKFDLFTATHKLSIVDRDPDEIKAIYIQYARQSSVSTFKKEVDEYCRHLWQREIKQGLMYSNYSGLKVRNSIMKMLAPYPRKVFVKTLRVLMNDFEVREVLFRSKKSKTDICPYCRVVDATAHFLFSCVSYQEHRRSFIKELQNQNIDETLVGLLNCENKHVINALAGFIASIE